MPPVTKRLSSRRGIDDGEDDSFQPTAPRRRGENIKSKAAMFSIPMMSSARSPSMSAAPLRSENVSLGDSKPPPPQRGMSGVASTASIKSSGSSTNLLKEFRPGGKSVDRFSVVSSDDSSLFVFKDDDEESSAFVVNTKSMGPLESSMKTIQTSNQKSSKGRINKSGSSQVGFNWVEAPSVSGSTAKSLKSEKSISSNTVAAARVEPKLRPQTVVYVSGPDHPTERPSRVALESTIADDCDVPETQLISRRTEETDMTVPLAAELVYPDPSSMEMQMRERILRESVHAEVVGHDKQFRIFVKKYWWIFVIFVIITIGVSVVVALVVSSGNSDDNGATNSVTSPSSPEPPTIAPTASIPSSQPSTSALLQRYNAFHGILKPLSGKLLDVEDSPQRSALTWLVEQDEAKLIPEDTPKRTIEERYVIAVVYFATSGSQWAANNNFLAADHLCTWNFETFNDGINGVICNSNKFVTKLDLAQNRLKGTIPLEVGYLVSLTELDFNGNAIIGPLPSAIGQLTMLKVLNFDFNIITGSLPSEIFELSMLEVLWIDDNALSGSLPDNIGNAKMLDSVALIENRLTGAVPAGISTLKWIQRLDLEGNSFVGPLPSFEGNVGLVRLYLGENQFTGTIPSTIGNCTFLQQIRISNTLVRGPIPLELAAMPNLNSVALINNTLTGTIPPFASMQKNLEFIGLYNNRLSGNLEEFFSVPSTRLSVVDFENNLLSGTIPATIGVNSRLEYLVLAGNALTGTLPTVLGQLTNMETFFQFYSNQLTGTIPTELGRLTRVRDLALSTNLLTGKIPSELGLLSDLSSLYLSTNLLTGSVPSTLAALPTLESMYIHNNELTGDLESSLCARIDLINLLGADCLEEVTCGCCTYCCDTMNVCQDNLI